MYKTLQASPDSRAKPSGGNSGTTVKMPSLMSDHLESKSSDLRIEFIGDHNDDDEIQNCRVLYPDGRIYEGGWNIKHKKPDGKGTMFFYVNENTNCDAEPRVSSNKDKVLLKRYSGEFKPTHITGDFEVYADNGSLERKYEGEFLIDGTKHGSGMYTVFKAGGEIDWSFDGRFENDRPMSGIASNMPKGSGGARFSGKITNGV